MQVKVDQSKCIGCGTCASTAPEVFELIDVNGEMKASVKAGVDLEKDKDLIAEAIDGCAVGAISIGEDETVEAPVSDEGAVEEIEPTEEAQGESEALSEEGSGEGIV